MNEDGNPVLGIDGNNVLCIGTWLAPINVEQCRSAISCAHDNRGHPQFSTYSSPCPECLAIVPDDSYKGCRFHRGKPHLWSNGNPKNSKVWRDWLKRYLSSKSAYITNGDTALSPEQLRKIRAYLLTGNLLFIRQQSWKVPIVGYDLDWMSHVSS